MTVLTGPVGWCLTAYSKLYLFFFFGDSLKQVTLNNKMSLCIEDNVAKMLFLWHIVQNVPKLNTSQYGAQIVQYSSTVLLVTDGLQPAPPQNGPQQSLLLSNEACTEKKRCRLNCAGGTTCSFYSLHISVLSGTTMLQEAWAYLAGFVLLFFLLQNFL